MSGFSAEWLHRREPFDAIARDADLARRFAATVSARQQNTPCRIVDLAGGSGASFRALAPLIGRDQDWLLVDHDPLLIAAQATQIALWAARNGWACDALDGGVEVRVEKKRWRVRSRTLDLAHDLEALGLASCDGVTTNAFLDLVSSAWLERLCSVVTRRRVPLLATLTVDGRRDWHPASPADARLHEAFTRHQGGDKGFGVALGPSAASCLSERLAAHGYTVATARSDWRISANERDMLLRLVDEYAAVASEEAPSAAGIFAEWSRERAAQIESGLLSLDVGHVDVLGSADG